jgi:hypothetical protein
MYIPYCANCKNSYGITNSIAILEGEDNDSDIQKGGSSKKEKSKSFDSLDEILFSILSKSKIDKSIVEKIDLNELKKNDLFNKLTKLQKEYIENYIRTEQPKKKSSKNENSNENEKKNICYYKCGNCGYFEKIEPGALIFIKSISKKNESMTYEDYKYMIYDNTLPRTSQYTCKNNECKTHKDKNIEKEAVFFRISETNYQLIYTCCVCQESWLN